MEFPNGIDLGTLLNYYENFSTCAPSWREFPSLRERENRYTAGLFFLDRKSVQFYSRKMTSTTYSNARDHLAEIWDQTVATREPVVVSRRGTESIVLVPLDEWEGTRETAHLLRSPANARRLLGALLRLEQGEGEHLSLEELRLRSNAQ